MLTQAVGYAGTALAYIAAAGGKTVLIKDIAKTADIPGPYLAKIVQVLSRKGLVNTQRGVGGGVVLAKAAQEITMHEVCVALDDPVVRERCMLGTAECSDERACPCHHFWVRHRAEYQEFLRRTTVADIAAFEVRRRWKGAAKPGGVGGKQGADATLGS